MSGATQTLVKASYYRSQLYTAYLGVNPMVAAAHPIFSLIERINLSRTLVFNANLNSLIEHELKAFETRAIDADYNQESIMIGRYLLSAVIQEGVAQHNLSLKLIPSSKDESDAKNNGNCFFEIIERIIHKPEIYLDLLELAYLCLSTGYKGSYSKEEKKLDKLKDALYKTICQHRTFDKKAAETAPNPTVSPSKESSPAHRWMTLSALSLSILLLTFTAGNSLINASAKRFLVETPSTEWQKHYG